MATIAEREAELVDEFSMFDSWMDRYQYLIDMGRQLPDYPASERQAEDKVSGCQSQVWFQSTEADGHLKFRAVSDAAIVSGLIAVLLRIYDDRPAQEIVDYEPTFVSALGLDQHLSQSRANGLHAMLQRNRARAAVAAVRAD